MLPKPSGARRALGAMESPGCRPARAGGTWLHGRGLICSPGRAEGPFGSAGSEPLRQERLGSSEWEAIGTDKGQSPAEKGPSVCPVRGWWQELNQHLVSNRLLTARSLCNCLPSPCASYIYFLAPALLAPFPFPSQKTSLPAASNDLTSLLFVKPIFLR